MRTHVGPFKIERVLGEGGMGVVYAAQDERLGRLVALKTIRPANVDPEAKARLWREARAAASVSHPNVCHIYEVGEVDGELYVAMEHLEGETLETRLGRGALPSNEAVEIALQVLAALAAMHARGIVHRDLKPANVFLTPHGAKVLDFGLALPLTGPATDGARLTLPGVLLGTPGYMAPEQWTGDPVGPTADLFALGSMLFEMATGRPAFTGRTVLDIYNAVAREQPPALTGGPAVMALDRVLQHALAKEPRERPTSADEMAAALRGIERSLEAGVAPPRVRAVRRLMVLPFRSLRPDPDTDFLALALPDAVVSTLAGRSALVVRSSHAARRYEGQANLDLKAIAAEAAVDAVVTGTLMRAGDRLRVAVQLVEAPSGEVSWSETLQTSLQDLFGAQDEIARRVSQALAESSGASSSVAARPSGILGPKPPATATAFQSFLRANQLAFNSSQLSDARNLYEAALAEDPLYAPAWARLGRVHRVMAKYGQVDPAEGYRLAEHAFRRALELDPDLPAAHNLFTYFEIEELGRARDAMTRLLGRALVRRDDPELFAGLVTALRFCGLLQASVEADRRARSLDPSIRTSVTYTHLLRRDFERALRYEDQDVPFVRFYALPLMGRTDEALAQLRSVEGRLGAGLPRVMLGTIRATLEGDAEGVKAGIQGIVASGFHDPEGLYLTARHAARVGLEETALAMLEGVVVKGFHVPSAIGADAWLRPLGAEPRFQASLARAQEGRDAALAAYREAGGEDLLGPASGPEEGDA